MLCALLAEQSTQQAASHSMDHTKEHAPASQALVGAKHVSMLAKHVLHDFDLSVVLAKPECQYMSMCCCQFTDTHKDTDTHTHTHTDTHTHAHTQCR